MTLQMNLGGLSTRQTGWYRDTVTGQYYYYDAQAGRWYVYSAGYLYPLAIAEESAPYTRTVQAGDQLKIIISYKYQGPASAGVEEYFSIGYKDTLGYHPEVVGANTRNLPVSGTPTEFTSEKTLTIPVDVRENWNHIECKVWHGDPSVPETGLRYINALEIVGVEAEITEFTIDSYEKVA